MIMALLIGIGARKRTGKDTFANYMTPWLLKANKLVKKISFVEPARRYVKEVFPDCPDTDENKEEYRKRMIAVCKATLDIDPLAYTKSLVTEVKKLPNDCIVFAPDLRRRSEYDYVKKHLPDQFISIRVDRGEIDKEASFGEGDMDDDKLYDILIDNNGTLEELNFKAQMIYLELMDSYEEVA